MDAYALALRPRRFLGAEELVELGQRPATSIPTAVPPAPGSPTTPVRTIVLSRDEGMLLVRVVENIIAFAKEYVVEFQSYCPPDRWQETLRHVGTWVHEIESQVKAGKMAVTVPAEMVFRTVDLEKCISAARDARLDSAKLAFMISAGGAIGSTILGLSWLGVPAYIAGLAILLGRPLIAKFRPEPQEPYRSSLGEAVCVAAPDLGDHTDKAKVLERVILFVSRKPAHHHWGTVQPIPGPVESAACLAKGQFRVRVEGWRSDSVTIADGWKRVPLQECKARVEIAVWEPCSSAPRNTVFGPVPMDSGHEDTFWVEYVGPMTDGACRRAGPFG